MRPELLRAFGLSFHAYPTMLAAAFITCSLLAVREAQRRGVDLTPQAGIWAYLGGLFGARLVFAIQYLPWKDVWRSFLLWEGGLVFYGGLLGALLAMLLYVQLRKLPRLDTADCLAPYVALGEAIVRIGCFLNGCCWGKVTQAPWGVRFPMGSLAHQHQIQHMRIDAAATSSLPVHPTQLYMTAGLLVVFVALKRQLGRKRYNGAVAVGYLLGYGMLRFVVEFFRDDTPRWFWNMTFSQALSLVLAVTAVVIGLRKRRASFHGHDVEEATVGDAVHNATGASLDTVNDPTNSA